MILIGRGLDLKDQRESGSEAEWKVRKRKSWSDGSGSGACAVLRVRKARANERLKRSERAKSGTRKREAERERSEPERGSEGKREERASEARTNPRVSGDNSLRDPPVPIPNTEVKPQHADSTWRETARQGRSSPDSNERSFERMTAFSCISKKDNARVGKRSRCLFFGGVWRYSGRRPSSTSCSVIACR